MRLRRDVLPLGCMGKLVCWESFAFDLSFSEQLSGLVLPGRGAINAGYRGQDRTALRPTTGKLYIL